MTRRIFAVYCINGKSGLLLPDEPPGMDLTLAKKVYGGFENLQMMEMEF